LRLGLALDELITNIIMHGFAGRSCGSIKLVIDYADSILSAELVDDGPPFDPLLAEIEEPHGDIASRKVGGLGVSIVKASVDQIRYERIGGFNCVNMEIYLKAAQAVMIRRHAK
jgi:serine/threonine-protein kinase RsbW